MAIKYQEMSRRLYKSVLGAVVKNVWKSAISRNEQRRRICSWCCEKDEQIFFSLKSILQIWNIGNIAKIQA
jgi:RNase P protein component